MGEQIVGAERLRDETRRPIPAKILQRHAHICRFTKVAMEFSGGNLAAFVAPHPGRIPKDLLKTGTRNRAGSMEGLHPSFEVEIDKDLTQIKQKSFNLHS